MKQAQSIRNTITELKQFLSEGRLVLFCGAGISKDFPSCLLLFDEYKNAVIDMLVSFLSAEDRLTLEEHITTLKDSQFPTEILMQQLYNHWGPKSIFLTDIFSNNNLKSNINHKIISALTKIGLHIILTTNFDTLIERELLKSGVKVIEKSEIREFENILKSNQSLKTPIVVKLHGSAGKHKEIIITLNQVGKVYADTQKIISYLLENNYIFLFLGYSGRDLDLFPLILGSSERVQTSIYWTFHPKYRVREADIEKKLKDKYNEKFIPIEVVASDLLKELLPNEKQEGLFLELKKLDKITKKTDLTQNTWKKYLRKLLKGQLIEVDKRRILSIFVDLASYIENRDIEKIFLNAAWKVNEEAKDYWGMAHTADDFVGLYSNLYVPDRSSDLLDEIKSWRQKLHVNAGLTEDPFIKGLAAASDAIFAFDFEKERNPQKAIQYFHNAIGHYNRLDPDYCRGKTQLIGQSYINIANCYILSCIDPNTNLVDQEMVDLAIVFLEKAEKCFIKEGAKNHLAEVYFNFAKCDIFKNLYDNAEKWLERAIYIYKTINDEHGLAQAYFGMGSTYYFLNNVDKAKEYLEKSRIIFDRLNKQIFVSKIKDILSEIENKKDVNQASPLPPLKEPIKSYLRDVFFIPLYFISSILSGISSVMFYTIFGGACIVLLLNKSWFLLVLALLIFFFNRKIRGKVGKNRIDVLINLVAILLLIVASDIKVYVPIFERFSKIYLIFVCILGSIIGRYKANKICTIVNILSKLKISIITDMENFMKGKHGERVIFDLNIRDAATVIYHFIKDPRPRIIQTGMDPTYISTEDSYDIYNKELWVRYKTKIGNVINIEIIKIIRIRSNKYLIRLEHDTKDWYLYSSTNYSDMRRAVHRSGSYSL